MGSPQEPTPPLEDFGSLVRLYWPKVFRFAMACLRDRDAAQSVAQDCFIRAHFAIGSFREEGTIQAWLMTIAANLIRDHGRSKQTRFWRRAQDIGVDASQSPPTAEEQYSIHEQAARIWVAARRLPKQQRLVFYYRFRFDLDTAELASITGLTEGSVKQHLFRAIQGIRRITQMR